MKLGFWVLASYSFYFALPYILRMIWNSPAYSRKMKFREKLSFIQVAHMKQHNLIILTLTIVYIHISIKAHGCYQV
jgi:hypothetical protein